MQTELATLALVTVRLNLGLEVRLNIELYRGLKT